MALPIYFLFRRVYSIRSSDIEGGITCRPKILQYGLAGKTLPPISKQENARAILPRRADRIINIAKNIWQAHDVNPMSG